MSRRNMIIAGCVAAAVAAIAIPLLLALDTGADDLAAYEAGLSEAIKAVPIVEECTPPLYDHFEATADNPEVFALSYTSQAESSDVADRLTAYFEGQSCRAITGGVLGDGFVCPDGSEAYFDLRPKGQCTFVSVALLPSP